LPQADAARLSQIRGFTDFLSEKFIDSEPNIPTSRKVQYNPFNKISDYEQKAIDAGATPEMLARTRELGKFLVTGKFTNDLGRN
jgi:hypothetical protein